MSKLTDEQIAIYQTSVDVNHLTCLYIVADGRHMTEEEVREIADGRTYTAKQAKENGLIDEISLYDEMQEEMQKSEARCSDESRKKSIAASRLQSRKVSRNQAEIATELEEELGSGVLMYYAEQIMVRITRQLYLQGSSWMAAHRSIC